MKVGQSNAEIEIQNFCKQYFKDIKIHDFEIISPFNVDIVIDEIKLVIEFNGIYWHRIEHAGKNYHLAKTKMCNKIGYRLVHIWEDEWNKDKEYIKQKLINIFNKNEKFENKDILILDQSWFNNLNFKNYKLIKEELPQLIKREKFFVEDCGKLIFQKIDS